MKRFFIVLFFIANFAFLRAQTVDIEVVGFLGSEVDTATIDTFYVEHDSGYSPIFLIANNSENALTVSDTLVMDIYFSGFYSTTREVYGEALADLNNGEAVPVTMNADWITVEEFDYPGFYQEFDLCMVASIRGTSIDSDESNNENCYYVVRLDPDAISDVDELNFDFYPNPCNDILEVESAEALNMFIFDASGRMLKNFGVVKSEKIDVSEFSSGIYYLLFSDKNKKSFRKLVIE